MIFVQIKMTCSKKNLYLLGRSGLIASRQFSQKLHVNQAALIHVLKIHF